MPGGKSKQHQGSYGRKEEEDEDIMDPAILQVLNHECIVKTN